MYVSANYFFRQRQVDRQHDIRDLGVT